MLRYAALHILASCYVAGSRLCSSSSSSSSVGTSPEEPERQRPFSLLDVMGDAKHGAAEGATLPSGRAQDSPADRRRAHHSTPRPRAYAPSGRRDVPSEQPKWAPGTPESVRQVVREAVLGPLEAQTAKASSGAGRVSADAVPSVSVLPLTVRIADKFGMPAELPPGSPTTIEDLLAMCPTSALKEQLQNWFEQQRATALTQVQQAAIPFALEHRDVLCIGPTATGKTFAYLFPTILRLAMNEASEHVMRPSTVAAGEDAADASLSTTAATAFARRDVEALMKARIDAGEVCRYCELSVVETPICPMTGVPHPPPPSALAKTVLNGRPRRAVRLEELSSTAEPRVLILVPTSQLAFQVFSVCKRLSPGYTVRYMVRASSAEEQKRFLSALEGTDILVSTPETILPAMYKQKLSLKRVSTLILDEVDDLVSVNHFEPLKIVLGALPKGAERPQRLLFGASLPPVAYNMIKEKMLLPSHRFVLADVATDTLGHPLQRDIGRPIKALGEEGGAEAEKDVAVGCSPPTASLLTTPANGRVTHVVFMLGRVEKIQKLAWLYHTGRLTADQRTIVFCNSRNNVAFVQDRLSTLVPELKITTLTSRASATAREGVLRMFFSGVSTCLVCTDLLSRGIDFKGVVYVVHYDMPLEMEAWVHRNGRCGRSGMPGYVYTFFQPENIKTAKPLVAYLRQNRQLIPPKLQECAKQSFVELLRKSTFNHPTRPYRRDDPQNTTPVLGRGTARFPDYRQEGVRKHFRPL